VDFCILSFLLCILPRSNASPVGTSFGYAQCWTRCIFAFAWRVLEIALVKQFLHYQLQWSSRRVA
jgi:hypothetical protein